jgi:NAD(P)H-hydrate epimerase
MRDEILSIQEMRAADAFAVANGVSGEALMDKAGSAVADAVARRWSPRPALILCGPGNNGGDGYVCAARLASRGWPVRVAALGDPDRLSGDAAWARGLWTGPIENLAVAEAGEAGLIVDALFGAGLARPLEGAAARWVEKAEASGAVLVAVDTPSGLDGDAAKASGAVFQADLTVTFHRPKPAHLLYPGRALCGEIVCVDIGILPGWEGKREPNALLNHPGLWSRRLRWGAAQDHKHRRGRLGVFTGGAASTGAARMAAEAGLRVGAGLVTLLSPPSALLVNASASTAVMVARWAEPGEAGALLEEKQADAAVIGPAAGTGEATCEAVLSALDRPTALVLDADALTAFEAEPAPLFAALRPGDVLTPHAGEFRRIFPDIAASDRNKMEQARLAADRAGAVVVFKGPDTVIASPKGIVVVNARAAPGLATAGTGDVLAGLIGGLLAQGLFAPDAAAAGVWIHAEAGLNLSPGQTAEDLLQALPTTLHALRSRLEREAALSRIAAMSSATS